MAPTDNSQRGRCCHLYIGPTVVTCPEIRCPPSFWFSGPAPCRYSQPRAGRPTTECERGPGLSALAGTPNAESAPSANGRLRAGQLHRTTNSGRRLGALTRPSNFPQVVLTLSSAVAFWPSGCTAVTGVPARMPAPRVVRSGARWRKPSRGCGGEFVELRGVAWTVRALGRWCCRRGPGHLDRLAPCLCVFARRPAVCIVRARRPAVCALAAGRGTFDMITGARSVLTQAGGG
jgi:hypothetical protein